MIGLNRHDPRTAAIAVLLGITAWVTACSGTSSVATGTTASPTSPPTTGGSAGSPPTSSGGAQSPGVPARSGCAIAPAAVVGSKLGVSLTGPVAQIDGQVTLCTYASGPLFNAATVRIERGMDAAAFQRAKAALGQHGEPTSDIAGLGDAAYSSSIGSGRYATTTVVVLKGTNELLVTAVGASVGRVQAVATTLITAL